MKLPKIAAPRHDRNAPEFRKMARAAERPPRADTPESLPLAAIKHAPDLFQPRSDSVTLAPGRSEAHVAKLAKEAKAGRVLDPVTVVAIGSAWYLVDGHHRIKAYEEAGWSADAPVQVVQGDMLGAERVEWAIGLSLAENKKDRLSLGDADKMTRAWQAVAREAVGSIRDLAERYGVGKRSIAYMKAARAKLEDAGHDTDFVPTWTRAKEALKRLKAGEEPDGDFDWREKKLRELARRLKPVMDLQAPASMLLEVLEAYDPQVLAMLNAAKDMQRDDDLI